MLDVDNGPEALSSTGNAVLYETPGLADCRDSLALSGHLLLWTGFEDLAFVERARAVGFSVTRKSIPLPNRPDQVHVLYVLSREPLSSADRDRVGLEGSSTAAFDPKRAFAPGSGFQSYP